MDGSDGDDSSSTADASTSDTSTTQIDAAVDGVAPVFTLTSSMLVEGQPFAVANRCDDTNGRNINPALNWTNTAHGEEIQGAFAADGPLGNAPSRIAPRSPMRPRRGSSWTNVLA